MLHEASTHFAKEYVPITRKDADVIFHARKSALYSEGESWVKKETGSFDLTMGKYDGRECVNLLAFICYI